jgi:hypothetical protein
MIRVFMVVFIDNKSRFQYFIGSPFHPLPRRVVVEQNCHNQADQASFADKHRRAM